MDTNLFGINNPSISTLPLEVLTEILSYLDKSSKLNARRVNRTWRDALDAFFFRFNATITDESFLSIRDSHVNFHTLTVKDFVQKIPVEPGTSLSRCKLALNPASLIFRQRDPGTRRYNQESVSSQNIEKMLLYNKNVKYLKFGKNSLQALKFLRVDGLLMKNLETLDIKLMEDLNDQENQVLLQIAKIKKPSLTKLMLSSTKMALVSNEKDNFIHYITLFNFIAAHKSTLSSLDFQNFYPMVLDIEMLPISSPDLVRVVLRKIQEDLNDIKLTSLKFLFPRQEGIFPYNLGYHLLTQQDRLTNLEVSIPFCGDLLTLYREVCSAIQKNRNTLTLFSIHRYIVKPSVEEIRSVLKELSTCPNLQDVQLFLYTIPCFFYKFSPTIKYLTLVGNLTPGLLVEIKESFPLLELLRFSNLSAVTEMAKEELRTNLKAILQMPNVRRVQWYTEGFDMDFLSDDPQLSIRRTSSNFYIFTIYRRISRIS